MKSSGSFDSHYAAQQRSRMTRNLGTLFAILWFLLSVYPMYHTYVAGEDHDKVAIQRAHPQADQIAQATITETVLVPLIQPTALPGALPEKGYNPARVPDATDIFKNYNKRENCSMSSLELHGPFEPLCRDKYNLLRAMSEGGRLGLDAPFSPRGCDMRWFNDEEICEILSRFETVYIIGDSMMRNLATAMHIYLRRDLVHGGHATWFDDPDEIDCSCQSPFETSECGYFSVVSSSIARDEEPESFFCSPSVAPVEFRPLLHWPIPEDDLEAMQRYLPRRRNSKPPAFVFGNGLWNDLQPDKTIKFMEQTMAAILKTSSFLAAKTAFFPKLFVAPNAAGPQKPGVFLARQGNIAVTKFEHALFRWAEDNDYDFLGTYNMSVQASNPDGTHGGMKTNLIKAMMVLNWLNALDVPKDYYG